MLIPKQKEMTESEKIAVDNSNNQYLQALSYVAVGTIYPYAGDTPPETFMFCDGKELDVDEYTELFGVIGYKFGGSEGKFHLPNLKGRTLVGKNENDEDFKNLGNIGGEKKHKLCEDELPKLNGSVSFRDVDISEHNLLTSANGVFSRDFKNWEGSHSVLNTETSSEVILNYLNINLGGDAEHNNMQPYVVVNYIIKVMQGISINNFGYPYDLKFNPESENAQSGIAVAEAVSYKADKIVNSASGENILLTDSSNYAIEGLKVYGKSTQDGTPTPEAPIPIVSAGASGSVEVKVCGANLLPFPYVTKGDSSWGGITSKNIGDGTLVFNGTCTERYDFRLYGDYNIKNNNLFGKKFIVSGVPNIDTANFFINIAFYKDGVKVAEKKQAGNSLTVSGIDFDGIYMHIRANVGVTLDNVVCKPMVSLVSADYEPYTEQILTLATPNELHSVSDYADYIDLERGVFVQNCYKATESEFSVVDWKTNGEHTSFTLVSYSAPKPETTKRAILTNISNTYSHTWTATANAHHFVTDSSQRLVIVLPKDLTTIEQAKEILNNGIEFLYLLAEPIETPLTAEELAYYKALHTNYPNTTIFNSDGTNMDVSYIADTKSYIDNKFAEISAAIVNNA